MLAGRERFEPAAGGTVPETTGPAVAGSNALADRREGEEP